MRRMKFSPPLIAAIAVAVLLISGLVLVDVQLGGATRDINGLRYQNTSLEAQVNTLQGTVNDLAKKAKAYEAALGPGGSLQALAAGMAGGSMDLSVKSLKVVAGGKPLVYLGANADLGGLVEVASTDGLSNAEIASVPGSTRISFKADTGAGATHAVLLATYGVDGFYLQKGATDAKDSRSAGAGLHLLDAGTNFFMSQAGAGDVSIDTASDDEQAKMALWADSDAKKRIDFSLGTKDAAPTISLGGGPTANTLALRPDRLTLLNKDGAVALAAAEDDNGGFLFVNDGSGERRALVTAGTEGHGSVSVYGSDKRSNTLYPTYNIQQSGPAQK